MYDYIKLNEAAYDYLLSLQKENYTQKTLDRYERILSNFSEYVKSRKIVWKDYFTLEMLRKFTWACTIQNPAVPVKGLSHYLYKKKKIHHSLKIKGPSLKNPQKKKRSPLPDIYEEYISYNIKTKSVIHYTDRVVLSALNSYCQKNHLDLHKIKIQYIDEFLGEFTAPYKFKTRKAYRSALRCFLRYLYYEKKFLKRDLASLIITAPDYSRVKPPKFFRQNQIHKLFSSVDLSVSSGIRTYAMMHLIYYLGFRPKEISLLKLDDIAFCRREVIIKRKNGTTSKFPLPENTIKAIAAYIFKVRPETRNRNLFLRLREPYIPVSAWVVSRRIKEAIMKAELPGSAYWLRHTFAQNLFNNNYSIYEIKEMMGHDSIQTTKNYIQIDIKSMRGLIDEEV